MKEIDARGLACPAPVLEAKAVIEKDTPTEIKILVDNEASKENVFRFLSTNGYKAHDTKEKDAFVVFGRREKTDAESNTETQAPQSDQKKIMVMVTTDRMGFGDDRLGLKLMSNFIKTLKEMGPDLWRLVFLNNGVKLTIKDSASLTDLKDYEREGLGILVCGTCLQHFNLLEDKKVGETTNMLDIVTAMQLADKVITI